MNINVENIANTIQSLIDNKVNELVNENHNRRFRERWSELVYEVERLSYKVNEDILLCKDNSYSITSIKEEGYRMAINDIQTIIKDLEQFYKIGENDVKI